MFQPSYLKIEERMPKQYYFNDELEAPDERARERIRYVIELGSLVRKAGLADLLSDDHAALLGAFLELADRLRDLAKDGVDPGHLVDRWRRRGLRATSTLIT